MRVPSERNSAVLPEGSRTPPLSAVAYKLVALCCGWGVAAADDARELNPEPPELLRLMPRSHDLTGGAWAAICATDWDTEG